MRNWPTQGQKESPELAERISRLEVLGNRVKSLDRSIRGLEEALSSIHALSQEIIEGDKESVKFVLRVLKDSSDFSQLSLGTQLMVEGAVEGPYSII